MRQPWGRPSHPWEGRGRVELFPDHTPPPCCGHGPHAQAVFQVGCLAPRRLPLVESLHRVWSGNTCAGAPPTFRVLIQVCPGLLQLPGDQPVSVLIGGCSSVLSSREDQRGSESTSVPYHSSTVHISRNIRGRGNSCSSSCCFCAPWTTGSLELL